MDREDASVMDRQDAMWKQFEGMMASRALVSISGSALWLTIAIADGVTVWWFGLFALVSGATTLLHARRALLGRIFDAVGRRSPGTRDVLRRAFPFPVEPHAMDLPSALEVPALAAMALATGWVGGAFSDPTAAVAATAAVLLTSTGLFTNIAAHPSYEMTADVERFRPLQVLAVLAAVAAPPLFLWPALDDQVLRVAVIAGCVLIALNTLRAARHLYVIRVGLEQSMETVRHQTLVDLSMTMHTELKNPAEGMLRTVILYDEITGDEPAPETLRKASLEVNRSALFIGTRVSQFVDGTRAHQVGLNYTATDITRAVLRCWPESVHVPFLDCVIEDSVDPQTLDRIDRNLLTSTLSELVTNCLAAEAEKIEVAFRAVQLSVETSGVEVEVRCCCHVEVTPGRPVTGTMSLLARKLEGYGGGLTVRVHDSANLRDHSTRAWWPIDATRNSGRKVRDR